MFIIYKSTIEDVFEEASGRPLYVMSTAENSEFYQSHYVILSAYNQEGFSIMWRYYVGNKMLNDTPGRKKLATEAFQLRDYVRKVAKEKGFKVYDGTISTKDRPFLGIKPEIVES